MNKLEFRRKCGRRGSVKVKKMPLLDLNHLLPLPEDSDQVSELKRENYMLHYRNQVLRAALDVKILRIRKKKERKLICSTGTQK